jgi:hypothetical protein
MPNNLVFLAISFLLTKCKVSFHSIAQVTRFVIVYINSFLAMYAIFPCDRIMTRQIPFRLNARKRIREEPTATSAGNANKSVNIRTVTTSPAHYDTSPTIHYPLATQDNKVPFH